MYILTLKLIQKEGTPLKKKAVTATKISEVTNKYVTILVATKFDDLNSPVLFGY